MENIAISQSEKTNTMQDDITKIYEDSHKILAIHTKFNKISMCICQSLGYNGFKRWHRFRAKCFFDLDCELLTEIFDDFRIKTDFADYEFSYSPKSLEEHLKSWKKNLLNALETLGSLSKSYFEQTGLKNCVIEKAICKMSKDHQKICRFLSRFTESDWLTLDMHIVDDKLHKKFKQKEQKEEWKINGTMQMKS